MRILFNMDQELCSGCGACVVACMDQNDYDASSGEEPLRRLHQYEKNGKPVAYTDACVHCPDAPCIRVCSYHVLFRDETTGLVVFDNTNCVGCRACAEICPHDAIRFGADQKMIKCDGCAVRIHSGLVPACVQTCPTGALSCDCEQTAN